MNNKRIAAISGATSGIGRACVKVLLEKGISVVANSRTQEHLTRLEAEYNNNIGSAVHGFCADASREGMVTDLFAFSEAKFGAQPQIFILSAGHGLPGSLLKSDHRKWRNLVDVNYIGAMHQLRECADLFLEHARYEKSEDFVRDIVVIGSTVGRQLSAANPVYGSVKFAVHSLVESLRQEVCSKNIRITLIEPGFVTTKFQQTAEYDMDWFGSLEKEWGPFLRADDVARTIDFVIQQPPYVHVDDIRIRPTKQKM